MSPESHVELARQHLDRALAALENGDEDAAILWFFYATENAVEALGDPRGLDSKKNHVVRRGVADELANRGVVPSSTTDLLDTLNEARKDAAYDGDPLDPAEAGWTLDEITEAVETLVDITEQDSGIDD